MAATKAAKYTKELAEHFYETMCTIRKFEESVKHDFLNGEIPGFVHLYIGEEAIATGVCSALRKDDMIESTHRGHGHCVAKGADVNRMMAEIFGKKTGLCQGRGGSMHIADFSVGMLGANGVVGGGYNLATGAALASKMILKNDRVSVVFFGDGASNRGTFHEAMNVASAWKLPVIFVNEMNCWASTTPYRTTCNVENISDRAAGYHVPGVIVDGQDVFAVYEAAKEAVARARAGEGPTFIEAKTYRIEGHFVGDPELYRDHAETQKIYHDTDPLKMFRAKAAKLKLMTAEECDAIDAKCEQKIKDAKEYAMQSEYADASEYMKYVYVDDKGEGGQIRCVRSLFLRPLKRPWPRRWRKTPLYSQWARTWPVRAVSSVSSRACPSSSPAGSLIPPFPRPLSSAAA